MTHPLKFLILATTLLFLSSPFLNAKAKSKSAPLKIVSTAAPIHALLVHLTHGAQKPHLLLPPTIMPHGARLTPSQARILHNANLLVLIGESFAALESNIKPSATRHIVRLTKLKGITILPIVPKHDEEEHGEEEHEAEEHGEEEHGEEEHGAEEHGAEEHGAEEHEAEEHEAGEHLHEGSVDPHVWLDVENARVIVKRLAEILAKRDPSNAALYRKNARLQELSLRALDQEVRALVRGISTSSVAAKFLVLHDSTAYFTARYGIRGKERLYAARHNATRDGLRHTLNVRKKLRSGDYRCVIVQPQLPREVRTRLLGSDTRVVVIDPLGAKLPQDKNFYASLLMSVAEGFRECLAG